MLPFAQTDTVMWKGVPVADSWVGIVTLVGGVIAFGLAWWQYRQGEAWKKAEFLGEEIRRFRGRARVRNAIAMIDYPEKDIELFPDRKGDQRFRRINRHWVVAALADRSGDDHAEDEVLDAIRDCFDEFFDGIEQMDCFVTAGVLKSNDLRPFVAYWLEQVLTGKDEALTKAACGYLLKYQYTEVMELCDRLGVRP